MQLDWINQFLELVKTQYLNYGYLIVLLAVLIKHIILVGYFFPGGTILLFGLFYTVTGELSFPLVVVFAWLGGVLGNLLDYLLGVRGVLGPLKKSRFYPRIKEYVELAEDFVLKHGPGSVFLSQFVGYLRPVVALLAGDIRMPFGRFLLYQVPASLVWYCLFCGLGYFLARSFDNFDTVLSNLGLIVAALAFAGYLISRLFLQKFEKKHPGKEN